MLVRAFNEGRAIVTDVTWPDLPGINEGQVWTVTVNYVKIVDYHFLRCLLF